MVVVRLAVQRAASRDGDVLAIDGIDERRVVHDLDALEASKDDREVFRRILAEGDRRSGFYVEIHVARQMDRAGDESSRRYHDSSTASSGACSNGVSESRRAIGVSVADRAVARHLEIARGKCRWHDPSEYGWDELPPRVWSVGDRGSRDRRSYDEATCSNCNVAEELAPIFGAAHSDSRSR